MSFARAFADARPEEIALRDDRVACTWADVDDTLNRVANGLHGLDLGAQRRIAVFAENAVETAFANLGGLLAGASVVPVNFHLTAEEVAYILTDSEARVLFVDDRTRERGVEAAAMAGVPVVVSWGAGATAAAEGAVAGAAPHLHEWTRWLAGQPAGAAADDVRPLPNLLYTSGTTGRPKGTELPPTMFAGGNTIREHLENLVSSRVVHSPQLVVGPMYHTGPLSAARMLAAGCCSVILGRFDAEKTLAAIERYRIASSVMVPTHFVRLLALPEDVRARYDVSSLELVSHTGAKCPVDVKRAMIDWWGPVLLDAYGASEVGTTCMITSEEWLQYPGSVGRAVEPFEALILDDDDQPVGPNVEGRLYFRDATGRGVVYPNDPEKSAAAHVAPGVFTLGEIGYMNEEGYVYITDRFSDMVVSGGVNIYPAEAEQVLIDHPAVADVACIGVAHAEMGEQLIALAIAEHAEPPDGEAVVTWCRERLSHYKCPKRLEWVTDLGRNTMGKINKRKLRASYGA